MPRTLLLASAFIGVTLIGATLFFVTDRGCEASQQYRYTIQFGIGELVAHAFWVVLVLLCGIVLYTFLRKAVARRWGQRGDVVYFALLPLVVFPAEFAAIPKNLLVDRSLEQAICSKSTSDGLWVHSNNLSPVEYAHLQAQLALLPELPNGADSITIAYYHDGFLPDFGLVVTCTTAGVDRPAALVAGWSEDTLHSSPTPRLIYQDGEN